MTSVAQRPEAPRRVPPGQPGRRRSPARRPARGRRWSSDRRAPRGPRRARDRRSPQITKRSTPRASAAAAPAPAVVAADDGAFGQRAHLLVDRHGQRRIERPGDRPAGAARAHRVRGGGPAAPRRPARAPRRPAGPRARTPSRPDRHPRAHARGRPVPSLSPLPRATRSAPTARGSPALTSTCICRTLSVKSLTLIGGKYDLDQAEVRDRRPLLRGHVLPVPSVGA